MEKAVIITLFPMDKTDQDIHSFMNELRLLTHSAGGEVVKEYYQKRTSPDMRFFIGKGKADEVYGYITTQPIDVVIFGNSLNSTQQRNLEDYFNIKVIDRTRLIMDIFATLAKSNVGKLQVELAQMLYLLPRLTGKGKELSRLGGGIGTRGPGETKLESDRRMIKQRIQLIKKKLNKIVKDREGQRKNRFFFPVPVVSLVGYTSAGKSTLFKLLTREQVKISAHLFSTLDTLLRRVDLSQEGFGYYFLLSDTVGFIRQMPEELITSFKATLDELTWADIILHIIDFSNPDYLIQKREVEKILKQMDIPEKKVINIYNKIDLCSQDSFVIHQINGDEAVYISAKKNLGIQGLKKRIFRHYFSDYERFNLHLTGDMINMNSLARWAILVRYQKTDTGTEVEILCSRDKMVKFKEKYGGLLK